ncbi:hypothetical protein T484DRAFT_1785476 [Baffinella frigidus]|nr:hypothetical protein T484DRAFT_1785476 [Cryptophyta sp. CCMP2293]
MAILGEHGFVGTQVGVQALSLDTDSADQQAGDDVGALKSPVFQAPVAEFVHAAAEGNNTPARKLTLDMEDAGYLEEGDTLAHMSSPAAKPAQADFEMDEMGALQLPSQQEGVASEHEAEKQKKGLSHLSRRFQSMNDFSIAADLEAEEAAAEAASGAQGHAGNDDTGEHLARKKSPILTHTAGTVSKTLKRSQSEVAFTTSDDDEEKSEKPTEEENAPKLGSELLVVFDMDRTMVGDLVALSDRDNVETNVTWTFWPEGEIMGLSVEEIVPFLKIQGLSAEEIFPFLTVLSAI